jgi:FkbH-like protein
MAHAMRNKCLVVADDVAAMISFLMTDAAARPYSMSFGVSEGKILNKPVLLDQELLAECRDIRIGAHDPMAIERLGRRISKAIAAGRFTDIKVRVAVLSSFLTDMLVDSFSALLLARGVAAEIVRGPYGAISTDVLSTQSITRDCHLVLILPTHRDLAFVPQPGCSPAEADAAAEREASLWSELWKRIAQPIVQLSFDPPPFRGLSEGDGFQPGGLLRHIRRVNQELGEGAPAKVSLVDAEALAGRIGAEWHDPRTYHLCKQPFAPSAAPEVADTLASAASGLLGKARKVLVFDLDNTLWGGVVGDVGLQGIVLGKETAEGEAFVALQTYAKTLAARGIILAVCSKNNEEVAREPFRAHSGMVLKEEDIACFVANFDDKVTNLRRIAQTLNVGLDSLAFVDDNPVERAWVKQQLPEILVVDLPEDVALYGAAIEQAKPFPVSRLTAEDLGRNASYRARASVLEAQGSAVDMGSFLQGLEPVAHLERVTPASLDRIVQLLTKTNQFKLNPSLFSAEEISAKDEGVLAIRFADRLQEYGIVAVAVVEIEQGDAVIRNWVMSCRVFSRRLEHATLALIRDLAEAKGAMRIRAPFKLSPKNAVARDALAELGFVADESGNLIAPTMPTTPLTPHFIRVEKA